MEYKESWAKIPHSFFLPLSIFTHLLKRFLFLLSNTKPLSCHWMNKQYHFLSLFQENTMCGSQLIKVCVRAPTGCSHLSVSAMGKGLPLQRPAARGETEEEKCLRRDFPLKNKQNNRHWLGDCWENVEAELQEDVICSCPTRMVLEMPAHQSMSPGLISLATTALCAPTPHKAVAFLSIPLAQSNPQITLTSTVMLAKARAL